MLKIFLFLILGFFIFGCISYPEATLENITINQTPIIPVNGTAAVQSCTFYCQSQPHIQCVGSWSISGTYPDCVCGFTCDSEPIEENPIEENFSNQQVSGGSSSTSATYSEVQLPAPQLGVEFTDPIFNTTLRKITNLGPSGFGTHIYSQLQAFSPDSRYVLLIEDESYLIRRVDTLELVYQFPPDTINTPRWQPVLDHTIIHYDTNADTTLRVQYTDVDSGNVQTIYTFPAIYQRIRSNPSFDELSKDGRWMTGLAQRDDGVSVLFSFDIQNLALGSVLPLSNLYDGSCQPDPTYGDLEPDWTAPSPLGRYLVVQWARDGDASCSGLELFNISTGAFVRRISTSRQHGDLGVTDNTEEYFVTYDSYHPTDPRGLEAYIGLHMLSGDAPTVLQPIDWNGEHISCQGPNGICVITTSNNFDQEGSNYQLDPFDYEIWLLNVNGNILRLAHHLSSSCGYWVQPRASMSADGRYVIFASDWAHSVGGACSNGDGNGDAYLIYLSNEHLNLLQASVSNN